jgi:hypothetical protein
MKIIRSPLFNPLLLALVEQANAEAWSMEQGMEAGLWGLMRRAAADRDLPPHWPRWSRAWPAATKDSWVRLPKSSSAWSPEESHLEHEVSGEPGDASWREALAAKEAGATVWWSLPSSTNPAWAMGHAHKLGWALRLKPDPTHPALFQDQVLAWGHEVLRAPDWSQWIDPWADWMLGALRESLGLKGHAIHARRPEAYHAEGIKRTWTQAQQDSGNTGAWEEAVVAMFLLDRSRRAKTPCPIPKS